MVNGAYSFSQVGRMGLAAPEAFAETLQDAAWRLAMNLVRMIIEKR